eukprot:5866334-Lingulodinium_polyedra.AAC.1
MIMLAKKPTMRKWHAGNNADRNEHVADAKLMTTTITLADCCAGNVMAIATITGSGLAARQ